MDSKIKGRVKFFDPIKHFGFIGRDDGQADVFFHRKEVERCGLGALDKNELVEFEVQEGRNGKLHAANIARLGDRPESVFKSPPRYGDNPLGAG